MKHPSGVCPLCDRLILDGKAVGGIWTGSTKSKASNGPLYWATCKACEEELVAMPTEEDAEAGYFVWEQVSEFPGERFVAIMTVDGNMQDFLQNISLFVEHLKSNGFNARCPAYTVAVILVPKAEAAAAREFLKTIRVDYLKVWICDDHKRQQTYIGK